MMKKDKLYKLFFISVPKDITNINYYFNLIIGFIISLLSMPSIIFIWLFLFFSEYDYVLKKIKIYYYLIVQLLSITYIYSIFNIDLFIVWLISPLIFLGVQSLIFNTITKLKLFEKHN